MRLCSECLKPFIPKLSFKRCDKHHIEFIESLEKYEDKRV